VRTLVALLRLKQLASDTAGMATAGNDAEAHLRLARRLASPPRPVVFLMHGLSGSGKTHVSTDLMQRWPAIRVRSDVERKRLLGLAADRSTRSRIGAGAYSQQMTEATYRSLLDAAAASVDAGFSVIVDAASLRRAQRQRFRALAAARDARFVTVSCQAPEGELRRRLRERAERGGDASEADAAVLEHQLRCAEPLDEAEIAEAVIVRTDAWADMEALAAELSARVGRA
jgi:uncharacterized protein